MAKKPILLTVDYDPEVLRTIERDLRQKYGVSSASCSRPMRKRG